MTKNGCSMDDGANYPRLRLAECNSNTEWEIAKYFRQHYFFDKAGQKDPYVWTFNHKDHKHFVLYQNGEIIGYAHIQLWPNNRAALRIIVIDTFKRKHGHGSAFLALCEHYLKEKGIKSLHAESNPEALAFYKYNGYTKMLFDDPDEFPTDPKDTAVGKLL